MEKTRDLKSMQLQLNYNFDTQIRVTEKELSDLGELCRKLFAVIAHDFYLKKQIPGLSVVKPLTNKKDN